MHNGYIEFLVKYRQFLSTVWQKGLSTVWKRIDNGLVKDYTKKNYNLVNTRSVSQRTISLPTKHTHTSGCEPNTVSISSALKQPERTLPANIFSTALRWEEMEKSTKRTNTSMTRWSSGLDTAEIAWPSRKKAIDTRASI